MNRKFFENMQTFSTIYLILSVIGVLILFVVTLATPIEYGFHTAFNWQGLIDTIIAAFGAALGYYVLRGIALIGLQTCTESGGCPSLANPQQEFSAEFLGVFNRISKQVIPSYEVENYGGMLSYNASFEGEVKLSVVVEASTKGLQELTVRCPQGATLSFWSIAYASYCATDLALFQHQPYMDENEFITALALAEGQNKKEYKQNKICCMLSQSGKGATFVVSVLP